MKKQTQKRLSLALVGIFLFTSFHGMSGARAWAAETSEGLTSSDSVVVDSSTGPPATDGTPAEPPTTADTPTEAPTTDDTPMELPITDDTSTEPPTTGDTPMELPITDDTPAEPPTTDDTSTEPPTTDDTSTEPPTTRDTPTEPPTTDDTPTEPPATDDTSTEPSVTDDTPAEPPATDDTSIETPFVDDWINAQKNAEPVVIATAQLAEGCQFNLSASDGHAIFSYTPPDPIPANGAFSVLFSHASGGTSLSFDQVLPPHTQLTLVTLWETSTEFYYCPISEHGLPANMPLPLTEFMTMGTTTTVDSLPLSSQTILIVDFARVEGGHVYTPLTTQFIHETDILEEATISMGNIPPTPRGSVTIEAVKNEVRVPASQPVTSFSPAPLSFAQVLEAPMEANSILLLESVPIMGTTSTSPNTLTVTGTITAEGIGYRILVLSLLDGNGNPQTFPIGTTATLGENTLPIAMRSNVTLFDFGTDTTSQNYTVTFSGIQAGTYKVKADLCLIPTTATDLEKSHPMHGKLENSTTDLITVTPHTTYALTVTPAVNQSRVVKSGTQLSFDLQYRIENNTTTQQIELSVFKKMTSGYGPTAETGWDSQGLPTNISGTGTANGVTITVPLNAAKRTYRLNFTLGTTSARYNIIVD